MENLNKEVDKVNSSALSQAAAMGVSSNARPEDSRNKSSMS